MDGTLNLSLKRVGPLPGHRGVTAVRWAGGSKLQNL